jgi:porin
MSAHAQARTSGVPALAGIAEGATTPQLSPEDATKAAALATGPARLDKLLQPYIWNIPYPSYEDSLLQDYGGWRSRLAEQGFGIIAFSIETFEDNTLHTPIKVPAVSRSGLAYPACTVTNGTLCAARQAYVGERPAFVNDTAFTLTYDLSRWGESDGQIILSGSLIKSTDNQFFRDGWLNFGTGVYRQSLFNKAVDIYLGYQATQLEFVGAAIGGNFANTFGPAAALTSEFGMSQASGTPAAVIQYNMTDDFYNKFLVQRSMPVNGSTGNAFYDESILNQTGLKFTLSGANGSAKALYVDEVGYKNQATPVEPYTWIRFGGIYNSSSFRNYDRVVSDAFTGESSTVNGAGMAYFLADHQFWQQAPSSPFTAYRGIYAGISAEYAPDNVVGFTQYYDGRVYWIGPTEARATDLVSFVYSHNKVSSGLANGVNTLYSELGYGPSARHASNTFTVSYLAHLMLGFYASVGVAYTDHPSIEYFQGEGSALNFLASVTSVF